MGDRRRGKKKKPGPDSSASEARQTEKERLDALLDEALDETFPASDPIELTPRADDAVSKPRTKAGRSA